MTYVISDIHGEYEKYVEMLKLINFTDNDDLYVIGDVIDRGKHPIKILIDMSMRPNVFPILGNHEILAIEILRKLCREITEENCESGISENDIKSLTYWQMDGGGTTLNEFKRLDNDSKLFLLDYLEEFQPYDEITVNDKNFLLVHGGVPYDKREIPMSEQDLGEILTERPDYTKVYFDDKYLVTGHTPTCLIDEDFDGKIYSANRHIAIDCGAVFGKKLGCIRLDDFKEFYC